MMTNAEVAEMIKLTARFEGKTPKEAWEENTDSSIKADYNFQDIMDIIEASCQEEERDSGKPDSPFSPFT